MWLLINSWPDSAWLYSMHCAASTRLAVWINTWMWRCINKLVSECMVILKYLCEALSDCDTNLLGGAAFLVIPVRLCRHFAPWRAESHHYQQVVNNLTTINYQLSALTTTLLPKVKLDQKVNSEFHYKINLRCHWRSYVIQGGFFL